MKPLSDGLLIIRHLFGFEGDALVSGALGTAANRTDPDEIKAYIESIPPQLAFQGSTAHSVRCSLVGVTPTFLIPLSFLWSVSFESTQKEKRLLVKMGDYN